jgi:hypothetical protein
VIKINIGIIDADLLDNGTRHPNLALMKLSAYNKENGHDVNLLHNYNNITEYDKVYLSKVFDFTKIPIDIVKYKNIETGGTGLYWDKSPDLSYIIEHHMPDYHLYDEYIEKEINRGIKKSYFLDYMDYSIGFSTRRCFRKCPFCVNYKYDKVIRHAPVKEFYDKTRKYIYLWDDNILGYSDWEEVFNELAEINRSFQFRQGLDIRLLTEKKAEVLAKSKYKGDFIFAFDNILDKDLIINKINLWKKYYTKKGNTKLYVFCGFDRNNQYDLSFWKQDIIDTFERIKILMTYGCIPYIMRHENYLKSPFYGMYTTLARWCNQPSFFKKESLREYVYITDGIGREDKDYAAKRYINQFEKDYPEIAKLYYDLKFENLNIYNNEIIL